MTTWAVPIVPSLALAAALLAGCARNAAEAELADRGASAIQGYGCGACHAIPGVRGADGRVGPPLVDMAHRAYIGRGLPNTPENMVRWIREPQAFAPRSAMPDMQVSRADAQAITAYLYRAD